MMQACLLCIISNLSYDLDYYNAKFSMGKLQQL